MWFVLRSSQWAAGDLPAANASSLLATSSCGRCVGTVPCPVTPSCPCLPASTCLHPAGVSGIGYRPPGIPLGIGADDVVPPGVRPPGYGGGPGFPGEPMACCSKLHLLHVSPCSRRFCPGQELHCPKACSQVAVAAAAAAAAAAPHRPALQPVRMPGLLACWRNVRCLPLPSTGVMEPGPLRGGGGMHVGPGDPIFGPGRMGGGVGGPPGHAPGMGGLPPGARWDPIAPPGMRGFHPGEQQVVRLLPCCALCGMLWDAGDLLLTKHPSGIQPGQQFRLHESHVQSAGAMLCVLARRQPAV